MNLQYESLHSHTKASDGTQTYAQVLETAKDLGFGVIAFTDHDVLPTPEVMRELRAYSGPVHWTVGVELSSRVPLEVGGEEKGALHILGLFVDIEHRGLIEFCETAEASRLERMRVYVKHLNSIGFTVTEQDVLSEATSKNIVSPHMVKALWRHPENRRVMDDIHARMREEAKHNAELKVRYDEMILGGPNQYPYTLFMRSNSFIPAPQTDLRALRDYASTVQLIRDAGGLAVATHWFYEAEKMPAGAMERIVAAGGLDGLETANVNAINERDTSAEMAEARELVKRYNLLETMGSDSHTVADLEAFVKSPAAARSVGQTARLIERAQPNLAFSHLD